MGTIPADSFSGSYGMTRPSDNEDPPDRDERLIPSDLFGTISLDFLMTGEPHDCPYLPGREAVEEAFAAEEFPPELYHDFMDHGFRRSGNIFYRPVCPDCAECRPLRVRSSEFRPSKSLRRVLRQNEDATVSTGIPSLTDEKLGIYADYLSAQHGPAKEMSEDDLTRFLYRSPLLTLEFEYRVRGRLMAVGIVDACSRSLSSVYTYFDPEFSRRSPGTFSALKEILFCRDQGVPYYYLGFFVEGCPSMNYKKRFRPCEILTREGRWVAA
jgi:arginine-tRNA-protein transferase